MTVLRVRVAVWDAFVASDPDVAEAATRADWWGKDFGRPGLVGATFDENGVQLTPHTHYVWGDRSLDDDDLLEELSTVVEAVAAAPARPVVSEFESVDERKARRVEARRRARQLARRAERREDRVAERQAARRERRRAARTLFRQHARSEYRKAQRRDPGNLKLWSELSKAEQNKVTDWDAQDEVTQARWLREAANQVGHPDVRLEG